MTGPFDWIRPDLHGRSFAVLTVLFLVSTALVMSLDQQLVTTAAPNGIVSLVAVLYLLSAFLPWLRARSRG